MAGFAKFMAHLKAVGVALEGESILAARVASAESWTAAVADAARMGRKDGIRFTRIADRRPANDELREIVQGYQFTPEQQDAVIDNVMYV
ncbi:hypothetical protein bAD24_p00810 (plasmid) [Burkholderia sp. AD24]|nr:hypothetical protein bAD24_p00810 [Burkholderia sp. AD24]